MPHHTDIYPMPMFPTLSVADIGASASWYTEKVGFARVFAIPGSGAEVALEHLRWSKYADLLLVPEASERYSAQAKGAGITLAFLAQTEAIDDMAARLEANGVEIAEGPVDRPWNTRDIVVIDPDGFRLVFFEPIDTTRKFEEVIESARRQG